MESAARQASKMLNGMYEALSASLPFAGDLLAENCRRLCLLMVALDEASVSPAWNIQPKMHLVQELCEQGLGDRPALMWTNRDEDFGGSLAKLARRRGGAHSAKAIGDSALMKFIARHPLPVLVRDKKNGDASVNVMYMHAGAGTSGSGQLGKCYLNVDACKRVFSKTLVHTG